MSYSSVRPLFHRRSSFALNRASPTACQSPEANSLAGDQPLSNPNPNLQTDWELLDAGWFPALQSTCSAGDLGKFSDRANPGCVAQYVHYSLNQFTTEIPAQGKVTFRAREARPRL